MVRPTKREPQPTRRPLGRRAVVAVSVVAALAGFALSTTVGTAWPAPAATDRPPADAGAADLVALKSEAEAAALRGDLPTAHAAYRRLSAAAVGREFRGRLTWDLLERANADQDRVYWILMTRLDGADRAFNLGGGPAVGKGGGSQRAPTTVVRASGRP